MGRRLVDTLLAEALSRGYEQAQLWTQADNARASRLYVGRGFRPSGRKKRKFGELIVYLQRALPQTT